MDFNNCRLIVFILTILVIFAAAQDKWNHRKLTTKVCGKDLVYVKAEGQNDILHYLFSGYNQMSILSIKSNLNGVLNISTNSSIPHIEIEPPNSVLYAFGIVFNTLIEYDDENNTANIQDYAANSWKNHSTVMDFFSTEHNDIVFAKNITVNNSTGNVTFSFKNFVDTSRQDILPHLIVTSNSTQLDIVINKVNPSFKHSRFALATSFISLGNASAFHIKLDRSLDDEYTPGTFKVYNWVAVSNHQSFLQWKPVCYFFTPRSKMTSTYVKTYSLVNNFEDFLLNSSLAYNFFATKDNYNITSNIISFGLTDDKFYVRKNYTAWSATIGYGVPPAEKVSVMAIAIISVGLGIPVLLFLGGGIYLCVKRRRPGYQQVFGTISS